MKCFSKQGWDFEPMQREQLVECLQQRVGCRLVVWVLVPDWDVPCRLSLVPVLGCLSLRRNPSDADMGTGTLFGHRNKAAASCRTPNALRPPTPTASEAVRVPPLGGSETSIHRAVIRLNVVRCTLHVGRSRTVARRKTHMIRAFSPYRY